MSDLGPDPRLLRRELAFPDYALDLRVATINALTKAGIKTIGDLLEYDFDRLFYIRGIGLLSIVDIYEELRKKHLELAPYKHYVEMLYDEQGKRVLNEQGRPIAVFEDWYLQDMPWFQRAYTERLGHPVPTTSTTPTQGESS